MAAPTARRLSPRRKGARVVNVPLRGLWRCALAWHQTMPMVAMSLWGDGADDSYDFFRSLDPFPRKKLREGCDLVMGQTASRAALRPGAMPPLHRYLGNPVLSFLGRTFFLHPGRRLPLRHAWVSTATAIIGLNLKTTGMEVRQRDGGPRLAPGL